MPLNPEKNKEIEKWIKDVVDKTIIKTTKILFRDMKPSGVLLIKEKLPKLKFSRYKGIDVTTNSGNINNWHQPIINQPEIGILGIIRKKLKANIIIYCRQR